MRGPDLFSLNPAPTRTLLVFDYLAGSARQVRFAVLSRTAEP
jgi:hypothetical protein